MSVRPIDIQNSIVRSPDAKRIFEEQQERNQGIGVNHPDLITEDLEEENSRVSETEVSEESKAIRDDEQGKGSGSENKKPKKKKEIKEENKKETTPLKDEIRGNIIDVKAYY